MDKWNNWVFELEAEPNFKGEESYKELELRSSVSAVKITHNWKLEFDFDHRFSRTNTPMMTHSTPTIKATRDWMC